MMDSIKWKLNRCKSDENSPFLYEIGGHITIHMKNVENPDISFRQVIKSLPPVIVGHLIHQHECWINAGALIAEHLTRKFVPRALNWIDNNADWNSLNMKYNFETHIKGYSSQSINFDDEPTILYETSIGEWNKYPYRVDYTFLFNISSLAKKNFKWLGYPNTDGYKLRDQRFKTYINTIINSQSTEPLYWLYDVYKAMESIIFLVE